MSDGAGPARAPDVLAVGELRVHLVAMRDGPLSASTSFVRGPGGDLAYLAVAVARLGRVAALAGLVGDDPFGRYLVQALRELGVDTRHIGFHPRGRTPVAFLARDGEAGHGDGDPLPGSGDRRALFYREGGADQLLSPAWIPLDAVAATRVVVGNGVSLASALPRAALHAAFGAAADAGALVAFEVNWRPALWQFPERARDLYHALLPQVDILMLSASELIMLTGGAAHSEAARLGGMLQVWVTRLVAGRTRPLLVALTRGPAGSTYGLWKPDRSGFQMAHLAAQDVTVKDRTGAGEAFLGGLLVALLDRLAPPGTEEGPLDLGVLTLADVADIFAWANASGALATTRRGAVEGLPGRNTVLRLVKGGRGA